jgi:hypothetical protein
MMHEVSLKPYKKLLNSKMHSPTEYFRLIKQRRHCIYFDPPMLASKVRPHFRFGSEI